MTKADAYLTTSEAAKQVGVSVKALKVYEKRGLIAPVRTGAGWRAYRPSDLKRAKEIAELRDLGLSLTQVEGMLSSDAAGRAAVLRAREAALATEARRLGATAKAVRRLRRHLSTPDRGPGPSVAFDLPWPWAGERFELLDMAPLVYLTGPLFCGKTRLARAVAAADPGAVFLGLDRLDQLDAAHELLARDAALRRRVFERLEGLYADGAAASDALFALIAHLEREGRSILVVDMIEDALDAQSQTALGADLRRRSSPARARSLVAMTRSTAILDLTAVRPEHAILFCPANHSPPFLTAPAPGAPGFEAVATCLGDSAARARAKGVVARVA